MDATLKRLQETQIEILDEIDRVCRENGLRYSLYAGSLLGAVRHQNFIPWDDDLDICMPRADYEQLLRIWNDEADKKYILLNKRRNPNFTQSFSKIRKDHTCFLQFDIERNLYHTGIFVDVFPVDRMPDGKITEKKFVLECMIYQLLVREYVPPKGKVIVKLICNMILRLTSQKRRMKLIDKLERNITRWSNDRSKRVVFAETPSTYTRPMQPDLLDEYEELPFGTRSYMCFKKWDEYLTIKYKNYMKLPPDSERVWKHHPLILDFEHNYEELLK